MADTKKQHYVPQCYLRNFASSDERINVFDKGKMEVRTNQDISGVAMENHFYDLSLYDIYKKASPTSQEKIRKDLDIFLGTGDFESGLIELDKKKVVEKDLFANSIEGIYDAMLKRLISNSYNGSEWIIKNCFAISPADKALLSLLIAIQIIRTRTFRDTIGATFEQFVGTMAYKSQMGDKDALPRDAFNIAIDKEYLKLQHTGMLLDPEVALDFAKALSEHIWVVYVNKTDKPLYTSDDPVVNIPHKKDKFLSYAGLSSEGIEILFPISPQLLLGMYHAKTYQRAYIDRSFIAVDNIEWIDYFNRVQVVHCRKCVFSINEDFSFAKRICDVDPTIRTNNPRINVF